MDKNAHGRDARLRPARISIVLPTYNGARFLREALDSIAAQSVFDWELILGDDGSSDETVAVAESWARSDPRVRLIRHPRRLGIFGNLNALFAEARAPLVKIYCQDDVMQPTCLERQAAFMERRPGIGFSRVLQTKGETASFAEQDAGLLGLPEVIPPEAAALVFFLHGNVPGNLSNVMVRRAAWAEAGGFREDLPYAGDMEFWFRLGRTAPFGIVPERLNYVRSHDGQASVHLNLKNELVREGDVVLSAIYQALPAHTRARAATRLWGSANFLVQALHRGVRLLLVGRDPGLRWLWRRRDYAFGLGPTLLLYVCTGNRRWGLAALQAAMKHDLQSVLAAQPTAGAPP